MVYMVYMVDGSGLGLGFRVGFRDLSLCCGCPEGVEKGSLGRHFLEGDLQ